MASTRDLRRRIKSVAGTRQITKAMKMVAAAKLRRAQTAITQARPYADSLSAVLASLASRTEHRHPLLEKRDGDRTWLVVVSSDKGLCGSFNANLLRHVERELRLGRFGEVELLTIGRKAAEYFGRRQWTVVHAERETMNKVTAEDGGRIGAMCIKAFTTGQVDSVYVVYNKFVNLIRQEITVDRLLPIEPPQAVAAHPGDAVAVDYLYEPGPDQLLAALLPAHVKTQLQRVLYDSAAAEQAARMTSMEAATKNAGEMIDNLTLLYNRTRQAVITKELIEIVSGAQGLGE